MEYKIATEVKILKVYFDVSGVEYDARPPLIVTGLFVQHYGGIPHVEVLGQRRLKNGGRGTQCSAPVWSLPEAPAWVRELVDVVRERYRNA